MAEVADIAVDTDSIEDIAIEIEDHPSFYPGQMKVSNKIGFSTQMENWKA